MSSELPKLVAFDLDYTLWPLWMDTDVDAPFRREGNAVNQVFGVKGYSGGGKRKEKAISFYRDVPEILRRLRAAEVTIAGCSRTEAPENAKKTLSLLLVPPKAGNSEELVPAIEFFDQLEIYPVDDLHVVIEGKVIRGSKCVQFQKLHKKTGIPYSQMLFFDDEHRNADVEKELGVTFCFVSSRGLDERTFEEGLSLWRSKNGE